MYSCIKFRLEKIRNIIHNSFYVFYATGPKMTLDVEIFRQIKDKSLNICVDGYLFPSLIEILYDFVPFLTWIENISLSLFL